MRSIAFDRSLDISVKKYALNLFKGRRRSFEKPIDRLTHIWCILPVSSVAERNIVEFMIKNFNWLVQSKPIDHIRLIDIIETRYTNIFHNGRKTYFNELIYWALRYEDVRTFEIPKYLIELKVKSCVYCNAQLAIVVEKNNALSARLQMDHFFSKDKYPFLSISFYNLIPCCSNCNLAKGNNSVELGLNFHLYSSEIDELVRFNLDRGSILKYLRTKDISKIKILMWPGSNSSFKKIDTHNELFGVDLVYDTQKDVAEEIILKSIYYNQERKDELKSYRRLFPDDSTLNRFILGNYTRKEEIFKRPLAKFTQDIARQLKLI